MMAGIDKIGSYFEWLNGKAALFERGQDPQGKGRFP
jgi:hypothetical protein